jgi:hypothetical protein
MQPAHLWRRVSVLRHTASSGVAGTTGRHDQTSNSGIQAYGCTASFLAENGLKRAPRTAASRERRRLRRADAFQVSTLNAIAQSILAGSGDVVTTAGCRPQLCMAEFDWSVLHRSPDEEDLRKHSNDQYMWSYCALAGPITRRTI